jgi:hypothetical protein
MQRARGGASEPCSAPSHVMAAQQPSLPRLRAMSGAASGGGVRGSAAPALRLHLPRAPCRHALYHRTARAQRPPQRLPTALLRAVADVAAVDFGRVGAFDANYAQRQRRGCGRAGRGQKRALLQRRLHEERALLLLLLLLLQ